MGSLRSEPRQLGEKCQVVNPGPLHLWKLWKGQVAEKREQRLTTKGEGNQDTAVLLKPAMEVVHKYGAVNTVEYR